MLAQYGTLVPDNYAANIRPVCQEEASEWSLRERSFLWVWLGDVRAIGLGPYKTFVKIRDNQTRQAVSYGYPRIRLWMFVEPVKADMA